MKRKRTAFEKQTRRERKRKFMTIFVNGRQKRVPQPALIDGLSVEEFIARNADPIWLHENGYWEFLTPDGPEGAGEQETAEQFEEKQLKK